MEPCELRFFCDVYGLGFRANCISFPLHALGHRAHYVTSAMCAFRKPIKLRNFHDVRLRKIYKLHYFCDVCLRNRVNYSSSALFALGKCLNYQPVNVLWPRVLKSTKLLPGVPIWVCLALGSRIWQSEFRYYRFQYYWWGRQDEFHGTSGPNPRNQQTRFQKCDLSIFCKRF